MKTENDVRGQYADIVEDGDDAAMVHLIASLDDAYMATGPPAAFVTETAQLLRQRTARKTRRPSLSSFGWTRLRRERPVLAIGAMLLAVLAVATTVAFAASAVIPRIHVLPPEKQPTSRIIQISNSLPPLNDQRYRPLDPAVAAYQSGLPVAYLGQVPHSLRGTVGVQIFLPTPWLEPQWRAPEAVRSVVRYQGGHSLLIALYRLAPQVVKNDQVVLGERTVHLPNGQHGWTNVDPGMVDQFWVTTLKDGYVLTLYSDLPFRAVEKLATMVTLAPPSGSPGHRGIPKYWPPPLAAPTQIPGVDIALVGAVGHYLSHGHPYVTYSLTFANRGSGHERKLRFTLVLPRGLAFAGNPPRHVYTVRVGQGNGGAMGDSPLVITNRAAFARGVLVRARWTEHGVKGERDFHLAFGKPFPWPMRPHG